MYNFNELTDRINSINFSNYSYNEIIFWTSVDNKDNSIIINEFDKNFDKNIVSKLEKINNPNIKLIRKGLTKLPDNLPKEINGNFYCSYNKLTFLEGCPKKINGSFSCHNNQLTSLEWCPKKVGRNFYIHNNKLTSLKGCPKIINGNFDCDNNELTSLEWSPKEVNGDFDCSNNKLTSLKGCPKLINGDFYCLYNKKLSKKALIKGLKDTTIKGKIYTDYDDFDSYEELVKILGK